MVENFKEVGIQIPRKDYAPKNNEAENKQQMSLIPLDVIADMLCPAYEEGLEKYHRESWRKGFKQSVMMDACQRHLRKFFYEKEDFDPEYPEKHHLGAALFCIISMYNSWKNHNELDDRHDGDGKDEK